MPVSRHFTSGVAGYACSAAGLGFAPRCNQDVFAICRRVAGGHCFTEHGQRQSEALQRAPVRHLGRTTVSGIRSRQNRGTQPNRSLSARRPPLADIVLTMGAKERLIDRQIKATSRPPTLRRVIRVACTALGLVGGMALAHATNSSLPFDALTAAIAGHGAGYAITYHRRSVRLDTDQKVASLLKTISLDMTEIGGTAPHWGKVKSSTTIPGLWGATAMSKHAGSNRRIDLDPGLSSALVQIAHGQSAGLDVALCLGTVVHELTHTTQAFRRGKAYRNVAEGHASLVEQCDGPEILARAGWPGVSLPPSYPDENRARGLLLRCASAWTGRDFASVLHDFGRDGAGTRAVANLAESVLTAAGVPEREHLSASRAMTRAVFGALRKPQGYPTGYALRDAWMSIVNPQALAPLGQPSGAPGIS